MIAFFRTERNAAALLLVSALAGLLLCNLGFGQQIRDLKETELTLWGAVDHFTLMAWLGEFFIAGFFLLIGLELKRELTQGELKNRRAVLIPGLAALFGAVMPAMIYITLVPSDSPAAAGWAIPMATDVTFALAIFAIFGKRMPRAARVFLLAFAVIDDLIAILVIALFLGGKLEPLWLLAAGLAVLSFWLIQSTKKPNFILHTNGTLRAAVEIVLAAASWYFVYRAGVQPAVVGVVLGLMINTDRVESVEHRIHPWVAIGVLPIFAFFAVAIQLDGAFNLVDPLSVAILLRPIGKVVGICFGVWLAIRLLGKRRPQGGILGWGDYFRVSILGGIGFTVSLLVANSVFGAGSELANQAIIATLLALSVSMIAGALSFSLKK